MTVNLPPQPTGAYQIDPAFTGTEKQAPTTPFLLAPTGWTYKQPIVVQVPYVYQTPTHTPPSPSPDNADFAFAWVPPATSGSTQQFVAQVTVQNNNVWQSSPAARQALQQNFASFFAMLEAFEITDGSIVMGGTYLIAQAVASALPQALSEALYYNYRFNPGFIASTTPYCDLLPGMRLRLEFAGQQFVYGTTTLNGFVGTGRFLYDVISWVDTSGQVPKLCVGFDAFLGSVKGPVIANKPGKTDTVVAGIIDLHARGAQRRHYRLFYPSTYIDAASKGDESLVQNVAIIGADTLVDLESATKKYMQSGQCASAQPGNQAIECIVFRGRLIAIPEIAVTVILQGPTPGSVTAQLLTSELLYVPLGTTVRQVIDRFTTWNPALGVQPPAPGKGVHPPPSGKGAQPPGSGVPPTSLPSLSLQRLQTDPNSALPSYNAVQIVPPPIPPPTPPISAAALFNLPLVKGDVIVLNLTPAPSP